MTATGIFRGISRVAIPLLVLTLVGPFSATLAFSSEQPTKEPPPEESPPVEAPSGDASPATEPTLDERLDALLRETSEDEYREASRCLNVRSYRRVSVLSPSYLLFFKGDSYWLNKLKRPCPALKWNPLPVFQARGTSSHCENDIFYATSSMDLQQGMDPTGRPRGSYGLCYLGTFEQITPEQAVLLKE